MWKPKKITTQKTENITDYSIDELTNVYFDDVLFFEHIELLEFEKDYVQTSMCPCATPGCATQDYIYIRRINDYIVFLPAFNEEDEKYFSEITATSDLFKNEPVCVTKDDFLQILQLNSSTLDLSNIPPLLSCELTFVLRWQAYNQGLGILNDLNLFSSIYIASTFEDDEAVIKEFLRLLNDWSNNEYVLEITQLDEHTISMFFDTPKKLTEWCPIYYKDGQFGFTLGHGFGFRVGAKLSTE